MKTRIQNLRHPLFLLFLTSLVLLPKLPVIPTRATPVRIEDFLLVILLAFFVLGSDFSEWRKLWRSKIARLIAIWLVLTFISTLWGIFGHRVEDWRIALLFYFRQIEYISLLPIAYLALQDRRRVSTFYRLLLFLAFPVSFYAILQGMGLVGGFGGGFYGNRWVAATDRSFATFSGPYELGEFYVIVLPILAAGILFSAAAKERIVNLLNYFLGLIGLGMSAARIPVFLLPATFLTFLLFLPKRIKYLAIFFLILLASSLIPFLSSPTLRTRSFDIVGPLLTRIFEMAGMGLDLIWQQTAPKPSAPEAVLLPQELGKVAVLPTLPPKLVVEPSIVQQMVPSERLGALPTAPPTAPSRAALPPLFILYTIDTRDGLERYFSSQGVNLVKGFSFEESSRDWRIFGGKVVKDPAEAYDGQNYVLLKGSEEGQSIGVEQAISGLDPRRVYLLSAAFFKEGDAAGFSFYSEQEGWHCLICFWGYRSGGRLTLHRDIRLVINREQPANRWTKVQMLIYGVDQLRPVIRIPGLRSGQVRIDNVELKEVDYPKDLLPKIEPIEYLDESLAWRVQSLWPRALREVRSNPFLGGGFSSLGAAADSSVFTFLGETGVLGFGVFALILFEIIRLLWRQIHKTEERLLRTLLIGTLLMVIGVILNSLLVDVFRASKIAMIFWMMVGAILSNEDCH